MLYRSTLLGQASGSLAGTTFSRNKGGQYTRARAVPTNPNSVAQAAVRQYFAAATSGWATLTAAERQAWADYASSTPVTNPLGDTVTNTGFNWFVATTILASRIAGAITLVTAAPVTPGLLDDVVTDIAISAATGATVTQSTEVAGAVLIQVGPVLSAGVDNTKGPVSAYSETGADPSGAVLLNRAGYPYAVPATGQRRLVDAVLYESSSSKYSARYREIVTVVA